jgi:uncharacterized protein (TIGR03437 family)
MVGMPRLYLLAFLISAPIFAQTPFINYRGIVNSASYARPGLPAGSIARGSIFAIFGRNFGPAQLTQQPVFPLTNTLGGVTIQVSQGNVTKNAIPIATITGFANAIMPSDTPLGKVKVTVTANGQTSNPAWVNVVESSFGIFSIAASGLGPGTVLNFNSGTDFPVNNGRVSAKPGQLGILYGTGLGAVPYADNIAPTQTNIADAAQVEVFVGGKLARIEYAGRVSCCSGLDTVYFNIPNDVPQGCFVPVQVRTKKAVVSNTVTIAIQQNGQPCGDTFNPLSSALRAGGKLGLALPLRTAVTQANFHGSVDEYTVDEFFGAFRQVPALDAYFDAASALPPLGTCTTYLTDATFSPGQLLQSIPGTVHGADSSKELTTAGAQRSITPSSLWNSLVGGLLGKSTEYVGSQPLFWNSGTFAFNIGASAAMGPLSAQFASFTPLTWPANDVTAINRANGLTLHWSGGNSTNEIAFIAGQGEDTASNSRALFICTAPIAAGTFTVPPEILAALPKTPANSLRSPSWIYLANMRVRDPIKFSAPGLDQLFIIPSAANARTVTIQ